MQHDLPNNRPHVLETHRPDVLEAVEKTCVELARNPELVAACERLRDHLQLRYIEPVIGVQLFVQTLRDGDSEREEVLFFPLPSYAEYERGDEAKPHG